AVAVALTGADAGHVAVPAERRSLRHPYVMFVTSVIEQAQINVVGDLGVDRKTGSLSIPVRAERKRLTGPDLDFHPISLTCGTLRGGGVGGLMKKLPVISAVMLLSSALAFAQSQRAGVTTSVNPKDIVELELLTHTEVTQKIKEGKTSVLIITGGTEE